jgi:hypothetical protein
MTSLVKTTCLVMFCTSLVVGCAADRDAGPSFGDRLTDPQVPARGSTDLPQWLAAGYYQSWRCEPARHSGRSPSPHGTTRVCNNDAIAGAASGAFPVGAAAVKELYDGDSVIGYAVSRKVSASGNDAWYWYERVSDNLNANDQGVAGCAGCHAQATRDFVFTVVL